MKNIITEYLIISERKVLLKRCWQRGSLSYYTSSCVSALVNRYTYCSVPWSNKSTRDQSMPSPQRLDTLYQRKNSLDSRLTLKRWYVQNSDILLSAILALFTICHFSFADSVRVDFTADGLCWRHGSEHWKRSSKSFRLWYYFSGQRESSRYYLPFHAL